ncbi:Hypothetical protein R9X50_00781100 [Acrodontium crateriforme]|uniref:BTB domain-containing protein n=1 Tax=Acrodontium crateriforme TaxID=150365 RepID=A0AAQ3MBR6_9PEZI|nr:Hypothetical protein R9X50_00781100 [Acrodontium crateriforme]
MFTGSRSKSYRDSFSQRVAKPTTKKQRSFKEYPSAKRINTHDPLSAQTSPTKSTASSPTSPHLNSAIVTLSVGPSQRLFAAHEDVLARAPYFAQACRAKFFETSGKRIELPNEEPEVFSAVLEYLYKGDYSPRLVHDKKRATWSIEDATSGESSESTVYINGVGGAVLKDTLIYCSANRYALPELQRLALKKQGLQSGVQCSTILSSARYAYANTPANDSKLRAHYLALVIRSRNTFKRSGTMQMEMEMGGTPLFFDLFVAMVNHLDDVTNAR